MLLLVALQVVATSVVVSLDIPQYLSASSMLQHPSARPPLHHLVSVLQPSRVVV